MGLNKKYAEMSIDGICQAYIDIDKIKFPSEAIELKNELEHRRAHGEATSLRYDLDTHDIDAVIRLRGKSELQEMPLAFNGSARDYFRIWIVNLCLTLLTFGIFSAWAKVRKKRYFYSHTTISGTPFQYLAKPLPILKGRLIAVAGFGAYYISSHYVTILYPYILGAGLVVAPWILARSAAFNARYSAYRNMTFRLDAGYWDAFKVLYAWGILPAFVIGLMVGGSDLPYIQWITSIVFTISFPWLICRIKKFIVDHTFFGGKKGEFSARGIQFFGVYVSAGLITSAVVFPVAILVMIFGLSGLTNTALLTYLVTLPTYVGYVVGFAYLRSKNTNLSWNHTHLGSVRFHSSLKFIGLAKLYLSNALGIIASCGLLIPWSVIRTMKYRATHMQVLRTGELTEFVGSDKETVAAIGAETLDIFDWDLSL